jgi:hypothetical protein
MKLVLISRPYSCRARASRLRPSRAAAGNVALIGQAAPRRAPHFRRRLGLELPMLADDDRRFLQGRGRRFRGASSAPPRSSAVPVGRLGAVLHGDKAVWMLVDPEPERVRSSARPRGVDS